MKNKFPLILIVVIAILVSLGVFNQVSKSSSKSNTNVSVSATPSSTTSPTITAKPTSGNSPYDLAKNTGDWVFKGEVPYEEIICDDGSKSIESKLIEFNFNKPGDYNGQFPRTVDFLNALEFNGWTACSTGRGAASQYGVYKKGGKFLTYIFSSSVMNGFKYSVKYQE